MLQSISLKLGVHCKSEHIVSKSGALTLCRANLRVEFLVVARFLMLFNKGFVGVDTIIMEETHKETK